MLKTTVLHSQLNYLLILVLALFSQMVSAKDALVLGMHPYKSPGKLHIAYTPLANYLTEQLQIPVEIRISRSYQSHIDAIGNGRIDIAYMGPASYVNMVEKYQKKPLLVRQAIKGKPSFQGVIFVSDTSEITSLGQLKGRRFAFGDPNSTMSHLVPRFMLWQAGVDVGSLKAYQFTGSHDNVALSVLVGDYDAGAVKEAVFKKYADKGLKLLATTPPLSEHLFVASVDLNTELVDKIRAAFLRLNYAPDGKKIMSAIKPSITAMVGVKDSDYDNLRIILKKLRELGVVKDQAADSIKKPLACNETTLASGRP